MKQHQLNLAWLTGSFAVCRLNADSPLPAWAVGGEFFSLTRTASDLSIVCPQEAVPVGVQCERGWCCLRVAGPLDFSLIGVLASLAVPLAEAGVSVFVVSTFDTDYLMVKEERRQRAVEVLRQAGHAIP